MPDDADEDADNLLSELLSLSPAQLDRQMRRIKELLFDDYSDRKDGSFEGNIKDEVIALISEHIPLDTVLSDSQFNEKVVDAIRAIVKHILDNTKGVAEVLAVEFGTTFVTQTICEVFTLQQVERPPFKDNESFMYG